MAQTAIREEEAFDLGALITLLSESYTASYRGSSLKVRRRYRKLITALKKAEIETDIMSEFELCKQAYRNSRSDCGD